MSKLSLVALSLMLSCAGYAKDITIAAEDDAAPWSFSDGTGYANDVVKAAFKSQGWNVSFSVVPYPRCKSMAEAGKILACFTTSQTEETKINLAFPRNALILPHNMLVAPKGAFKKLGCDKSNWKKPLNVLAIKGYEYVDELAALEKAGRVRLMMVSSEERSLEMIAKGRADLAIVTIDEVKSVDFIKMNSKFDNSFENFCDLGTQPGFLAFSKNFPESAEAVKVFDTGFDAIKKSGELTKIQQLWAKKILVPKK